MSCVKEEDLLQNVSPIFQLTVHFNPGHYFGVFIHANGYMNATISNTIVEALRSVLLSNFDSNDLQC